MIRFLIPSCCQQTSCPTRVLTWGLRSEWAQSLPPGEGAGGGPAGGTQEICWISCFTGTRKQLFYIRERNPRGIYGMLQVFPQEEPMKEGS